MCEKSNFSHSYVGKFEVWYGAEEIYFLVAQEMHNFSSYAALKKRKESDFILRR
jgi:hypothetical protein